MMYSVALIQPLLFVLVRAQLPDDGFRRCGQQGINSPNVCSTPATALADTQAGAFMNNTLWLDGGHEVSLNMSGSWTGNAPT
jgi:hypothetical protein